MREIKLNDILQISVEDLKRTKIRFHLHFDGTEPAEVYTSKNYEKLLEGQYWNNGRRVYSKNEITIGFVKIDKNRWLLFHIGRVTKELDKIRGVGYEYEAFTEYEKYFGRLMVIFENNSQNMIRKAESVIDLCKVTEILPDIFDNDIFPGYDKVNLSWEELSRVVKKDIWRTALGNQKAVYLITDVSNNRRYVGAAYGGQMLLGRWEDYVKTGHGENEGLKELSFDHIRGNFRYSILDIFKSTIEDKVIRSREIWWKEVLLSIEFGYNRNV